MADDAGRSCHGETYPRGRRSVENWQPWRRPRHKTGGEARGEAWGEAGAEPARQAARAAQRPTSASPRQKAERRKRAAALGTALSLLSGSLLSSSAAASPWTRPPGEPLAILRAGYQEAEAEGRRFEQWTSQSYLEAGLTPKLMVGGTLTHAWQGTDGPEGGDALTGIAEASAFLQRTFYQGERDAFSLALTAGAPTGTVSRFVENRRFERDASAGAALLYGRDQDAFFFAGRLGPEFSLGRDAHLLRGEVTLGRHQGRALFLLQGFSTTALGGAAPDGLDYDLYQLSPSVVVRARDWLSLQFGVTADIAGRGLDRGQGAFLALWIER
jgi:hypothetical protein